MQRPHIIATIVLVILFILVLGVGFFIGQQFENKKINALAFSAGWEKAINEFTENNIIPQSPDGLRTITGTVLEKNIKSLRVEIDPNVFMPIIEPNKKIREFQITDQTTFCKYLTIDPEILAEKIQTNPQTALENIIAISFNQIKVGADVVVDLKEDLRSTDTPTAKEICLQ